MLWQGIWHPGQATIHMRFFIALYSIQPKSMWNRDNLSIPMADALFSSAFFFFNTSLRFTNVGFHFALCPKNNILLIAFSNL